MTTEKTCVLLSRYDHSHTDTIKPPFPAICIYSLDNEKTFVLDDIKTIHTTCGELALFAEKLFSSKADGRGHSRRLALNIARQIFHSVKCLLFKLSFPPSSQEAKIHFTWDIPALVKDK